jgi:membrane protein YqaA with SNARE-associated domain
MDYLVVAAIVLGVNLMPAFGPPTWAVLVLYRLSSHLAPVPLVAAGALAAATGRLCLGYATGRFRGRLSAKRRRSLDALADAIKRRRRSGIIGLGLFALSPVPSAQLFEAAGLTGAPLVPLVIAFFAGRVVSYSIYVSGASALKGTGVGQLFRDSITSPIGVAVNVVLLAAVVAIGRIDWEKHLGKD